MRQQEGVGWQAGRRQCEGPCTGMPDRHDGHPGHGVRRTRDGGSRTQPHQRCHDVTRPARQATRLRPRCLRREPTSTGPTDNRMRGVLLHPILAWCCTCGVSTHGTGTRDNRPAGSGHPDLGVNRCLRRCPAILSAVPLSQESDDVKKSRVGRHNVLIKTPFGRLPMLSRLERPETGVPPSPCGLNAQAEIFEERVTRRIRSPRAPGHHIPKRDARVERYRIGGTSRPLILLS